MERVVNPPAAPARARLFATSGLILACLLLAGAEARAATTVGQTFVPDRQLSGGYTTTQSNSPAGQYTVPFAGVITAWSFQAANTGLPQGLKLKVARLAAPNVLAIVGESGAQNPPAGLLSTYTDVSIPVQAGDVIGVYNGNVGALAYQAVQPADGYVSNDKLTDLPPGGAIAFDGPYGDIKLDVSASLEPDCDGDGLGDETEDPLLAGGTCPVQDRILVLEANKSKVNKGKRVRLSGRVDAAGDQQACEAAQEVQVMRRKAGQATFKPIAAAVTDSDGDFSLKLRARRTSRYVASVALQPPCAASTSDSEKVRVKKR